MKKNLSKLALKTDKIVSLSKNQVQQVVGGGRAIAPTISSCSSC
ncbi:MAG: class I lanthipeptide [Spirosomataceae bacterium]